MRLWHQRLPGRLGGQDHGRRLQTLHGGKPDSLRTVGAAAVATVRSCQSVVPQPERINPETNQKGYNVKSDIWSLGITMVGAGRRRRRRAAV